MSRFLTLTIDLCFLAVGVDGQGQGTHMFAHLFIFFFHLRGMKCLFQTVGLFRVSDEACGKEPVHSKTVITFC